MADLKQEISDAVKTAMREKDKERLGALRLITAAMKQKEVDERIELDDTAILAILDKMCKQLRDSIKQFQEAGRDDLVAKEQYELDVISDFMPEQLDEAEILEMVKEAISNAGAETMKDMGKVMGQLKPKMQGKADMSQVSKLIKEQLT